MTLLPVTGIVEENDAGASPGVIFLGLFVSSVSNLSDQRFKIVSSGDDWEIKLKPMESLDHEGDDIDGGYLRFTVDTADASGVSMEQPIWIRVDDVNEAPVFMQDSYTATISEDITVGSAIETLVAQDVDDGDSLTYSITDGNEDEFFNIDATTGRIIITDLDAWTARTSYTLTVIATDSVGLTDTVKLSIENLVVGIGTDVEDTIQGTRDPDTIYGYDGDDAIKGGNGDDTLYGGAGNDNIRGNGGSDTLFGGAGNDILRGNGGQDFFVLNTDGSGTDTVKDFKTSQDDKIRVYVDSGITTLNEAFNAAGLYKIGDSIYKIVGNLDAVVHNEDDDTLIMELENFGGSITEAMFDFVTRITLSNSGGGYVAENDGSGVDTGITLTVTHSNTTLTSADFAVSDDRFEIVKDGNNWEFGLKNGEMLDYESAGEHEITVWVSDDINTATIKVNVEVTNVDDGDATVTISGHEVGLVSVDDILTATLGEDPDGLNSDVVVTYRWFHKDDPDKDIGTGSTYTVADTDDGQIIGVEVDYTDKSGATPSVTEIMELTVGALRLIRPAKGEEDNDNTLMPLSLDESSRIEGGNGSDTITDGKGNDIIEGGLGNDRIDLGNGNGDSDELIYRIGDQVAKDGADVITNFERGKDKFIFSLESNAETDALTDLASFVNYIAGGTPDTWVDDQFNVMLALNIPDDPDAQYSPVNGVYLQFSESTIYSGGRLSMPIVHIEFSENIETQALSDLFDGDGSVGFNNIFLKPEYLNALMGGNDDFLAIDFQVAEPDMV